MNELTKREREVLELLADGLTNMVIGEILGVKTQAVEKNISRIIPKVLGHIDQKRENVRVLLAIAWMEYKNE